MHGYLLRSAPLRDILRKTAPLVMDYGCAVGTVKRVFFTVRICPLRMSSVRPPQHNLWIEPGETTDFHGLKLSECRITENST